jgi:hypothetical protein
LVGVISVEAVGLAWLGAESERLAGTVVSAAPAVTGGFGATSAAVRALHTDVDEAARRIADRLLSTGEKVSNAARTFAAAEAVNEDLVYGV